MGNICTTRHETQVSDAALCLPLLPLRKIRSCQMPLLLLLVEKNHHFTYNANTFFLCSGCCRGFPVAAAEKLGVRTP